ncbi:alpha/beta-hydrolase [Polychaeton citri CBS 116435]|uniref:Carboxylic ester hydrolase n=1 Tax=Polychaeton citri CBS 116435 TaxID=1314669 RepID=A0A9P4Q9A8_9PEZI|nr:alpha/beta-hydrolase [Polychaeton citri CBS 116435]
MLQKLTFIILAVVAPSILAQPSQRDCSGSCVNDPANPVLDLGYARYRASTAFADINVLAYYGIPFAAPPTGSNRWHAPVPIERQNHFGSSSIQDASRKGPVCVQGIPAWERLLNSTRQAEEMGQEDCLIADVLVPTNPKSERLPIVVGIHGGGYTQGSSNDGQLIIAAAKGGLIWVGIQYRLGAYGFLSSAEIKENGVANAGLLDQRLAIEWAQRHAHAFGGDPGKITLWGWSSGGGSVTAQLILYGGDPNPPFRAAISEYPWWQSFKNDSALEAQYRNLLDAAHCNSLDCLRNLDEHALKLATESTYARAYLEQPTGTYAYGDFYYGPSVDGHVIHDLPSNEFKQGHFAKVALLTDHDTYEGLIFSNLTQTMWSSEMADLRKLWPSAKDSFFDRLYELYPASSFNSTLFQRQQIFGDSIIECPTYYIASAFSDWKLPTYKMIFGAGTQLHAATLEFFFIPDSNISNTTLGNIMKDYFTSFIVNLDPNLESYSGVPRPYWPQYNPYGPANQTDVNWAVMNINATMMSVVRDSDVNGRCDFFQGQGHVLRS